MPDLGWKAVDGTLYEHLDTRLIGCGTPPVDSIWANLNLGSGLQLLEPVNITIGPKGGLSEEP